MTEPGTELRSLNSQTCALLPICVSAINYLGRGHAFYVLYIVIHGDDAPKIWNRLSVPQYNRDGQIGGLDG